jgi:AraC-like DNA-binding protein
MIVGFFVHYEDEERNHMPAASLQQNCESHNSRTRPNNAYQVSTLRSEQHICQPRDHYRDTQLQHAHADAKQPSSPDTMQYRLQIFLSKHLRERVTLKDLSTFLGYSQKYCSEFFRLKMGVCFSHYVKTLRITKATGMLMDHDLPLSHIAELLGFSDSFAFSHFFKRAMGCSPSEFRKQRTVHLGFR